MELINKKYTIEEMKELFKQAGKETMQELEEDYKEAMMEKLEKIDDMQVVMFNVQTMITISKLQAKLFKEEE